MKLSLVAIFASLMLGGCSSTWMDLMQSEPEQPQTNGMNRAIGHNGLQYRPDSLSLADSQAQAIWIAPTPGYLPTHTHKDLSDYAAQLAMELIDRLRHEPEAIRVGVASFVYFDQSLQRTDLLGNRLAEQLISEVQAFGTQVVDFKTRPDIAINWSGDYVFSRDADELSKELALDYVLSGTIIYQGKGAKVNARLINMDSKVVAATASVQIPQFMLRQLDSQFVLVN